MFGPGNSPFQESTIVEGEKHPIRHYTMIMGYNCGKSQGELSSVRRMYHSRTSVGFL